MKSFRIPAGPLVELFSGIIPAARPLVLADRIRRTKSAVSVIFFPRIDWARDSLATIPAFGGLASEEETCFQWALLPPPPPEDSADDPVPERLREELECDRLAALTQLSNFATSAPSGEHLVVLTTPEGCFAPAPPRETLANREIRLQAGDNVDFNHLREQLARDLDYDAEAVCERPGQFALRGGLIDIYPLNGNAPCRLDFFGDELESIRLFDPTTQRSLDPVPEITLAARNAGDAKADPGAIASYFGDAVSWIFVEPAELTESFPKAFTRFDKIKDQRATLQTLHASREGKPDTWTGWRRIPFALIAPSGRNPFPSNPSNPIATSHSNQPSASSDSRRKPMPAGAFSNICRNGCVATPPRSLEWPLRRER